MSRPPESLPLTGRLTRAVGDLLDLHQQLQRPAIVEAAAHARGELLDVGCGNKPWLELFAPFVSRYTGVEHEAVFAQTAASSNARRPDRFYDGKVLPWPDASFDTVVSFQVLEHTPDPMALVHELRRVLRPAGVMILSAPFSYRLHEAPHDYFRYTPWGLRSLVEREGLTVESLRPYGGLWSVLAHKVNSHLVTRVGRLEGLGQSVGKFGQEASQATRPRWWTLPFVASGLAVSTALGRLGDAVAPDDVEALGYVVVARAA